MARTNINKTTLLGSYPTLPLSADSADLNMQALTGSSGSNGNQIAWGDFNTLVVVVQNVHATNAFTFTATSIANSRTLNRSGDISGYSLAAGDISVFYFQRDGWYQSDGNLYIESNSVNIKVGAFGI